MLSWTYHASSLFFFFSITFGIKDMHLHKIFLVSGFIFFAKFTTSWAYIKMFSLFPIERWEVTLVVCRGGLS